jgi:hypothetical protein
MLEQSKLLLCFCFCGENGPQLMHVVKMQSKYSIPTLLQLLYILYFFNLIICMEFFIKKYFLRFYVILNKSNSFLWVRLGYGINLFLYYF